MSGIVIDGLKYARDGRFQQGSIPVAEMARLADAVLDTAGQLSWSLQGEDSRDGSFLRLSVSAELVLECQRCLQAMPYPLAVETRLRLIPPGHAWPEDELEDDSADAIPAEEEMALLPLIEEEVLLALPIAPMHEVCASPLAGNKDLEPSPFAVLAKLKK